jgi:hypothetical protein
MSEASEPKEENSVGETPVYFVIDRAKTRYSLRTVAQKFNFRDFFCSARL